MIFFLFLQENICRGYSLEAPRRGTSNEHPHHMFSWRNKKKIMWIPPLTGSYETIYPILLCYSYWLKLSRTMGKYFIGH